MQQPYQILDFHCHIFPENLAPKATQFLGDHYKVPIPLAGTADELEICAAKAHVEQMVVHSTATKATQVQTINSYIAQMCEQHPKFIGFGSLHPDMDDIPAEVERIKWLGLKGIKLHPDFQGFKADSDRALRLFEQLDGQLPVLIHAGDENIENSRPKRIASVVNRFPHLNIVAAHFGGYRNWDEAVEYLYQTNAYIDTSSSLWVLKPQEANTLIRGFHSIDHILFGTDYPITTHEEELARFFTLDLTEDERRRILYDNAKQLLKI